MLALTDDNELYSWGAGDKGELGQGKKMNLKKPKSVKVKWSHLESSDFLDGDMSGS